MTEPTPDYARLIERLEKVEPDTPGEGVTRYYRNPDVVSLDTFRALLERYEALERERDELKHDVSRYVEIASDEATRAEAADARVKELEAENARLRERQAEADRVIDRLKLALQAERQKPMRCAACNGDGQVSRSYGYIPCDACNGRGF